jgi:hypothetical protein
MSSKKSNNLPLITQMTPQTSDNEAKKQMDQMKAE